MVVIVKVFHGTEVKRFRFPNMSDLNHAQIMGCLRTNFRDITEQHCFKYMDEDGDLCTLNESTFSDAFDESKSLITLYACESICVPTVTPTRASPVIRLRGANMPGIVCDSCDKPVPFQRYHCDVCPDFDLCEPCFEKPPTQSVARHVETHTFNRPSEVSSPRISSEWTDVSLGAQHVEGLLMALGLDVANAKDAVKKFLETGDFQSIAKMVKPENV